MPHEVHEGAPTALANVPAAHGTQTAAPEADALPRAHDMHWAMPPTEVATEYFPPGQLRQATEPAAGW